MLKHLISLVFLLLVLFCKPVLTENKPRILPEPKPKRILNFISEKKDRILPSKKPYSTNKKIIKKDNILPQNKPVKTKTKKIVIKKDGETLNNVRVKEKTKEKKIELVDKKIEKSLNETFLLPEKKPITYKKSC